MIPLESNLKESLQTYATSHSMERRYGLPLLLTHIKVARLNQDNMSKLVTPDIDLDVPNLAAATLRSEYIERDGDTPEPIFRLNIVAGDLKSWVVGVSGAQIKPEYTAKLTGGYVTKPGEFMAGRFDSLAAETFVERFRNPLAISLIPADIGNLARSH